MNNTDFENRLFEALLAHLNNQPNINEYLELLEFEPDNSLLCYVISNGYYSLGEKDLAKEYFDKAVLLNSNIDFDENYENLYVIIYYLFSTISTRQNPFCEDTFEAELGSQPSEAKYLEISEKYRNKNDISNSLRVSQMGYEKYPKADSFKFDKASSLLFTRKVNEEAWDYNELRFDAVRNKLPQYIKKPKFTLQKTYAKVYIYPVTKFGDTIFFTRYVKQLQKQYPNLKLFVKSDAPLKELFQTNGIPMYNKVDSHEVDYQISFEGLPTLFKEQNQYFAEKYLTANEALTTAYRENIFNINKPKIGIVWKSSKENDARNIDLGYFKPLFENKNIQFYSLQKVLTQNEKIYLTQNGVINLGENFKNFNETASAIENLDCVIGCDTSVTNLSGALGIKTFLALPNHADWRWELFEQKSHWYNSISIFRQKENADFTEVFERINKKIKGEIL